MAWAERHHGRKFARYLQRAHEPVDLVLRLAERSGIVLMPGAGFAGPEWSVRVSLANLPERAYGEIGAQLAAASRDYVDEWKRGARRTPRPRLRTA
jgi:aspartate 4-decarboxylase